MIYSKNDLMDANNQVIRCQIFYENQYSKMLQSGSSETTAAKECVHQYLDGKPFIKGLTSLDRSTALWNCSFWLTLPKKCFGSNTVALSLGRAIHFGLSDIPSLERIIQLSPELLKRAVRYSQVFLRPKSPQWLHIIKLSANSSADVKNFLKVCDCLRENLIKYDKILEKLKAQLADLTIFEFLLYGSLFTFQNLASKNSEKVVSDEENYRKFQHVFENLNTLLQWKLTTRPENDFRLNERFLSTSLKNHLIPLVLPTDRSPSFCLRNLDKFNLLMEAMDNRSNYWNQIIMQFCFDDDCIYKLDGDHLTLYPPDISSESEWEKNGRKLDVLQKYWLNRSLIEYALSELDDISFGFPENDAGNREAYIKATQVYLKLHEIYGLGEVVEVNNGTRVDLFKVLHSLELMTAFFKAYYIDPFVNYYSQTTGNWLNALGQLLIAGIAEGENRFPLTWAEPAEKAERIKSWTVSDTHPEGDIKAAEAILSFWTNDLYSVAVRLKKHPSMPVPEFYERPILQLGSYGFQLPWLMAFQNNVTAAVNNLRRIGCRRIDRNDETHRIENRLGELFKSKGFNVVTGYNPPKSLNADPGEIDLICYLERHIFLIEVKSTYVRKTLQDAWIYYTTTLRKATRQLRRKRKALLSAIEEDGELRANLCISGQAKDILLHSWIVDTSIEYDQTIIDGFLKVSLEGLIVILRNERYLLNGLLHEADNLSEDHLFKDGFSAKRFAEIVEEGRVWSVLEREVFTEKA
ncbi:MAG: NERD domain-containing protein [Candidatus Electrothrix sp. AS4_5]|nr:NERD domain-containing protein [Candidatus Electrothrix gigas]